jgi:ABC-2 type transport system permease protein
MAISVKEASENNLNDLSERAVAGSYFCSLPHLQKYASIFKISVLHTLRNYKLLIGLSIFEVTCLLIFAHIWKIAATRVGATDLSPTSLLWYIAFNEWVLIAVPDIELDMEHELKSGQLAYYLPRPISYLGSKLVEGCGALFINMVVLGIVAFVFAWIWTGILPLSLPSFALMVLMGFLGGFLSLVFTMVVGMSAFFVNEVEPWRWVWEKLLFVFGGLMLPLTTYPELLQTISKWSPFSPILGGRSGLVFNFEAPQILFIVLSTCVWSTLGLLLLCALYRKGLKQLNIQGG